MHADSIGVRACIECGTIGVHLDCNFGPNCNQGAR